MSCAGGTLIDSNARYLGKVGEISANAVLSGIVSELGGGKFANGAVTGAFFMMFNHMMHMQNYRKRLKKQIEKDGKLTLKEAKRWWKEGNGGAIDVDANKIIFFTKLKEISDVVSTFEYASLDVAVVYGQLNFKYIGEHLFTIESNTYDFDIKKNQPVRNFLTKIGEIYNGKGCPFVVNFKGTWSNINNVIQRGNYPYTFSY